VASEPAPLLGAGRALLLQVAHPAVAQGVTDHSEFQSNPFKRLIGTLEGAYSVVFGSEELAAGVGRRIRWIHDHVTGPTYRANDPENLLWVHATLLDTMLVCYEKFVGPLPATDQETLYQEMTRVAEVFGCPRDAQPDTMADFRTYFEHTVNSLEVTDAGRQLAQDIVRPGLPVVPRPLRAALTPALAIFRLTAIGMTPERLREQFGFRWDPRRQQRLDRLERAVSAAFRVTPRPARTGPVQLQGRYLLRLAGRHIAAFDQRMTGAVSDPAATHN
jgi:uncharacterized protein (DUF2236 family)